MRAGILLLLGIFPGLSYAQNYFDELERKEKRENKLVCWTYGYPGFYQRQYVMEKVPARYGFSLRHVAGCMVSDKEANRIKKHNNRVYKLLVRRIGENWRNKITKEADSTYRIDTTLIHGLYNYLPLQNKIIPLLESEDPQYEFRVHDTAIPGIFLIKAWAIDKETYKVTNQYAITIEATWPVISFRLIEESGSLLVSTRKPALLEQAVHR